MKAHPDTLQAAIDTMVEHTAQHLPAHPFDFTQAVHAVGLDRQMTLALLCRQFRAVAAAIGIEGIQIRDNRSGGITEAKHLDPYLVRDAAQHTQLNTTDRYVRGRSDSANTVVKLRRGKD